MKAALLALCACGPTEAPPPQIAPGSPEALTAYLEEIAAYPPAARAEAERGWQLGEAAWNRIVVEPFRAGARAAYVENYGAAIAAFDARLHGGTKLVARQHYAMDPHATPGELWVRWAVPTLYPSRVVADGAVDLGVVFLWDDKGWRALAGVDRAIDDAARAMDAKCARFLDAAANKECADVDYLIADSAIRSDRGAFTRACSLAAARCGIRSP